MATDQSSAKYLQDNIGDVLSKALAEMAVQQPTDGVEFLSMWLRNYAEQEEMNMFREKEEKQMLEDRAVTQKKEAEKATRREKNAADKKAIDDSYKALLEKFKNTETMFQDSYWKELVDVTKQYMGAQSVYLGLLDEEGLEDVEAPLVRYTHENIFAGSPTLLDKILPKMKDAETSNLTYGALTESVPEEELKQKYLWKPAPPPQPPVPEGEEPPPPPEGPKYLPVSVPCVTDVPTMHFFEMPRLGAYLACPLVYPTYYTQDAFAEAKKFEEEKAADLKAAEERAAERQAQIDEAREKGTEEPTFEEEAPKEEKVMTLPGATLKMVLCMDTLGTNTLFDESKYESMMQLCDACVECKSRTEIAEVDKQALYAIGVDRRKAAEDLESGLPSLREDAKTALQQQQDDEMKEVADGGGDGDAKKEVCYKKFAHLQAKMVVDYYKAHISGWVNMCFTAQPEVLNILAAIAFLIGYTKAEVYPPRKTMLKWDRMKSLISDDFFAKLEASSIGIGRKGLPSEQKLSHIQTLLPADFSEEKAREIDPSFEVLWTFLSTAVDYRSSALKQAKVEYDERKKEAESQDPPAAFDEPELTTIDDDFEALCASG